MTQKIKKKPVDKPKASKLEVTKVTKPVWRGNKWVDEATGRRIVWGIKTNWWRFLRRDR